MVISFLWSSHGDPSKWSVLLYRGDFDHSMETHQENYFDFLLRHPEFNEFNSMEVDPDQVEYTFIRLIGGVVQEGLPTHPLQQ